jgi:hypothetical protein
MEIIKHLTINGRKADMWMTRDAEGRKTYTVNTRNEDGSASEPTGNAMRTSQKVAIEEAREYSYAAICDKLGMDPDIHFVSVNSRGEIGFTAGKPEEIKLLIQRASESGMQASKSLLRHA